MLEALLSGAAEGLLLIQDSVACEGRSLLKSFITAAARRAESIHVLSFDLPELEFKDGLSTEVTSHCPNFSSLNGCLSTASKKGFSWLYQGLCDAFGIDRMLPSLSPSLRDGLSPVGQPDSGSIGGDLGASRSHVIPLSWILFHDAFPDPLGWSGRGNGLTLRVFSASELASCLATTSRGPTTLVLDSLSWLLLRLPFPSVCQVLSQLPRRANMAGLKIVRIVALVHGDLHPPAQLDVLKTLARLVVALQPGPRSEQGGERTPQTATVLHRKRGSQLLQKTELFSILPGFGFKFLGELPLKGISRQDEAEGRELTEVDPTAHLTFNLRLTEAERQARESVPLPYHFSEKTFFSLPRKSSLLQTSTEEGKIYYEPDVTDDFDDEDPDDDLDV